MAVELSFEQKDNADFHLKKLHARGTSLNERIRKKCPSSATWAVLKILFCLSRLNPPAKMRRLEIFSLETLTHVG